MLIEKRNSGNNCSRSGWNFDDFGNWLSNRRSSGNRLGNDTLNGLLRLSDDGLDSLSGSCLLDSLNWLCCDLLDNCGRLSCDLLDGCGRLSCNCLYLSRHRGNS